jgi:hypothetical protein
LTGLNFPQKRVKISLIEAILPFLTYLAADAKKQDYDIRVDTFDDDFVKLYDHV